MQLLCIISSDTDPKSYHNSPLFVKKYIPVDRFQGENQWTHTKLVYHHQPHLMMVK